MSSQEKTKMTRLSVEVNEQLGNIDVYYDGMLCKSNSQKIHALINGHLKGGEVKVVKIEK